MKARDATPCRFELASPTRKSPSSRSTATAFPEWTSRGGRSGSIPWARSPRTSWATSAASTTTTWSASKRRTSRATTRAPTTSGKPAWSKATRALCTAPPASNRWRPTREDESCAARTCKSSRRARHPFPETTWRSPSTFACRKPPSAPSAKTAGRSSRSSLPRGESSPSYPSPATTRTSSSPASTFKPYMALAALELGTRTPSQTIFDPGYFVFGTNRFRDATAGGHGVVDMYKSIVVSCDTYYYMLANDLGIDNIARFIGQFGFGSRTGIDIEGEFVGVLQIG